MDHNDAFSKDILAHPEDDAPRLIYADWLSEQDDRAALTRAEFIRVQYALEDLPPGDLRRVALEDRQRDILLTHEQEWTAGVRQLGLSECHFRRGFIEGLSLHPRRLVSVGERLRERVPLREARLRNWERYAYAPSAWADWETFAELDVLSQLTGLDLTDYSNLDAATASSLFHAGGLRRLQSLSLARHTAAALRSDAAEMPSLQSLCIRDAWGDGLAPMFAAPCIGALKRLAIRDTLNPDEVFAMVKSLHLDQLESLTLEEINLPSSAGRRLGQKVFPRLRHLALRGVNAVPDVKGGLLSGIETLDLSRSVWWEQAQHPLPRLRSLVLTSSRLDADAIASVANATRLPALESLNLRTNRVGDAGLAHLVSGNLPLRELGVSYNGITVAGLRALVKRWPQHLRSLDLSWNPCRDDGVLALTSSLAASELQRLDLSYCELTDRAAEALAGCSGLGNLQTLNLATNRIGDAGLAALAHSPYLGNLRTLHLGNSAVTNAGVETLVDSPLLDRLEVLMLTGTELDRETRKRLRKTYRGILG